MVTQARPIENDRLYSDAEFEALPERRIELIEGKVFKKVPTKDEHGRVIANLWEAIVVFDPQRKLGRRWTETTFKIKPGFQPEPDLALVIASRVPPLGKDFLRVVPDFVLEVLSARDLAPSNQTSVRTKIKNYVNSGVRLLWVVNPDEQRVEVYHAGNETPIDILTIEDELDGEDVMQGFKMAVADLFV